MAQSPQSLANHVRYVPLYHFVCLGLLTLWTAHAASEVMRRPSEDTAFALVLGVGLLLLAWYARAFALTAQNRVIRLEMTLRIQRLAPELYGRITQLTPSQLVALRFAGDGELAALVGRVLDGTLARPGDIKKAVRDWQADHLRV